MLDTNIVVSAALKPEGLQRTVFLLAITKPARLYVSQGILSEYRMALGRRELRICRSLRRPYLQLVHNHAHLLRPGQSLQVTEDPDDNIFLDCADEARADYLVTGNARHFPKFWKCTKMVTSRGFVSLMAPHLIP